MKFFHTSDSGLLVSRVDYASIPVVAFAYSAAIERFVKPSVWAGWDFQASIAAIVHLNRAVEWGCPSRQLSKIEKTLCL
jgi:hypothetical protein